MVLLILLGIIKSRIIIPVPPRNKGGSKCNLCPHLVQPPSHSTGTWCCQFHLHGSVRIAFSLFFFHCSSLWDSAHLDIRREEILSTPRKKNVARIANVALQKCPGSVSPVCFFYPLWPVCGIFLQICLPNVLPKMTYLKGLNDRICCKLVIVHKHVVGRLIPYNLELACVRKLEAICPDVRALPRRSLWMATSWMNHSVRKVGVEYRAAWRLEMS